MVVTTYLLLLLQFGLFISGQSLTFTGPPASNPLDLSTPIEITWTTQPEPPYSQVDLVFTGDGNAFSYDIVSNLSVSAGNFTWDPRNVSAALQSSHKTLVTGKSYYFQATLHNKGSLSGEGTPSQKYQVTGYPYIGSAAGKARGVGMLMTAGLSLVMIAVVR